MDKVFLVANLKSYKTQNEAREWLAIFINIDKNLLEEKTIIVCPPLTLLDTFKSSFAQNNLNVAVGAQNVSPFDQGPYTGEVNAKQIKDFAEYVLVGHSERRNNFGETDDTLFKKVEVSLRYELQPIFFVQDTEASIPENIELIAYEPVFAIGSGTPDTPQNANEVAGTINSNNNYQVLYGGSVTSENINSFTKEQNLKGALVGGASLNAEEFIKIIQNA